MIFLSARGTDFTWDLEKSVYGIFITSDDVWSSHKAGLKACVLEAQSILVGAALQAPILFSSLLSQKRWKFMHIDQVSGLKGEEGQGAEMVDKVTTLPLCLFLLIPFSFVCVEAPKGEVMH